MKEFIKEIDIECFFCKKKFNKEDINIPKIISIGHLICKNCLNYYNENEINTNSPNTNPSNLGTLVMDEDYNNLLHLFNSMKQNNFSLLSFTYCNTCGMFVANYSSLVHSLINHQILSLNNYTFIKWKKRINPKIIKPKGKFFFLLYYFQNPEILKIQKFNIKEFFPSNNFKFFFCGETIEENNNDFINKYIRLSLGINEKKNNKEYKIKKGMLIGKNIVMNGFFLCFENNKESQTKYIIQKGFGILTYEKIQFIGFVKLFNSIKSGFSLEIGILNENNCFYIGEFNEDVKEYPLYTFELGEIIDYNDETNISLKRKVYEITYYDYFKHNQFFIYVEIPKLNIDRICLSHKNLHKIFNKIYDIKEVNIEIQISINNNKREFERINQVVLDINESLDSKIIIEPLQKVTEQLFGIHLHNCKVYKKKKNINILIDEDKNDFIISDQYNEKTCYIGYLIDEKELTNNYKNLTIYNTIHNYNEFIKLIDDLINLNLDHCNISIKIFKERRIQKNKDYIKINAIENRFEIYKTNSSRPKKIIKCKNLTEMKIENILPNINSIQIQSNIKTNLDNLINEIKEKDDNCFIY